MLLTGHSSLALHNFSQPPRLFPDVAPRQRRITMASSRPLRPASPRRRAITDITESRMGMGSRSRSDSNMSTYSSWEKLSSPSSDVSNRPTSRQTRSSDASLYQEDRPESRAMTFFTKGSKLLTKRKKSRLDLSPITTAEWMDDTDDVTNTKHVQELSKRRKSKHSRAQSFGYEYVLKKSISDPYNFKHLTHTAAHQADALKCTDQNELVSEFSALRASQAPRPGLKGIKAEALHRSIRSVGSASPMTTFSNTSMSTISPTRSRDEWSETTAGSIRYSRSVDSFTKLSARSFCSPTPPISPPARRSSRMAMILPPNHSISHNASPTALRFGHSKIQGSLSCSHDVNLDLGENDYPMDLSNIAQAVTTPDDSAYTLGVHQRTSPSAGLADVPEEDEAFPWYRKSNASLQLPTEPSLVRHSKSFPSVERVNKQPLSTSDRTRYKLQSVLPEEWGTASDPTLPCLDGQVEDIPVQSRLSRRISAAVRLLDDNWEDDIDYCYEHAAEADSAFDWCNLSRDTEREPDADVSGTEGALNYSSLPIIPNVQLAALATNGAEQFQRPGSRASSCYSTDMNSLRLTTSTLGSTACSAVSSAVTAPGAVTPIESAQFLQSTRIAEPASGTPVFPLSPLLYTSQEYTSRIIQENPFHHKLANGEYENHHGHESDLSCESSLRSSDSLSGKGVLRDVPPIRPVSIIAEPSKSSSIGSLPDLVHSKVDREWAACAAASLVDDLAALHMAENRQELSLIIEATRQTFLRKATAAEAKVEAGERYAPLHPPLAYPRLRSNSDSANQTLDPLTSRPTALASAGRTRASSTVTPQPIKRKTSRASYSLFPVMVSK